MAQLLFRYCRHVTGAPHAACAPFLRVCNFSLGDAKRLLEPPAESLRPLRITEVVRPAARAIVASVSEEGREMQNCIAGAHPWLQEVQKKEEVAALSPISFCTPQKRYLRHAAGARLRAVILCVRP